jgi:hypothetical protein
VTGLICLFAAMALRLVCWCTYTVHAMLPCKALPMVISRDLLLAPARHSWITCVCQLFISCRCQADYIVTSGLLLLWHAEHILLSGCLCAQRILSSYGPALPLQTLPIGIGLR